MPTAARVASILTMVLATLAVAACGGADETEQKNAYVRQVNAVQSEFASNVTTVSSAITAKSSAKEDRASLRRFEAAIKDVVGDLEKIDVPEGVMSEHRQLVAAMNAFGTGIASANAALRDPTTRTLDLAQQRISSATQTVNTKIDAAIAAINTKLGAS